MNFKDFCDNDDDCYSQINQVMIEYAIEDVAAYLEYLYRLIYKPVRPYKGVISNLIN